MKRKGKSTKPWSVWRLNSKGEQIERVAEADTQEKLTYTLKEDWLYGIYHNRKRVV